MLQMATCIKLLFGGLFILISTLVILIFRSNIPLTEDGTVMEIKTYPSNEKFSSERFPKIIHQIWLGYDTKEPPASWRIGTEITRQNNPDFAYKLWSNKEVIEFLAVNYPWFAMTYYGYTYNVQRADAARYFIITHYGGIYLDMDEIVRTSISDIIEKYRLARYDCMLPAGTPNGITNYIIMCKRRSPFLTRLTTELPKRSGWYGIPYATVMWSTGPRFLSGVYDSYLDQSSIYIMNNSDTQKNFECLFGQTWFRTDGVIIHAIVYPFIRMGVSWKYVFLLVALGIIILFIHVIWIVWSKKRGIIRPDYRKSELTPLRCPKQL